VAVPLRERPRRRARVALDGEVEVDSVGAAQQVASRAADKIGRRQPVEGREQPIHARQAPDALAQVAHSRTAIPAARIRSFASCTLYWP
jgi:hypothetical protein